MVRRKEQRTVAAILLISIALIAINTLVTVQAKTYPFTATISPTEVDVDQLSTYTVIITNTGETTIGSTSTDIPAGFTVLPTITIINLSSTWSYDLSNTTISLTANGGGAVIPTGANITFTFDAIAPSSSGMTTWTTQATSGIEGGGVVLTLEGAQPTVNVIFPFYAPTIWASAGTINQGQASFLSQLTGASGGTLPYNYQWFKALNGGTFSPIADANEADHVFSPTTSTATGTWSFKLDLTDSSSVPVTVTSNTVDVIVNSALDTPEVTATPNAVSQSQVSTLTSTAVNTGTPPYIYQWFQKAPGSDYVTVGDNSASYIFPGTTAIGTWTFFLRVTDNTGASVNSNVADLTVSTTPISTFTITVTQTSHGTINPGATSVTLGSDQTFTISPEIGYQITNVLVDGISIGSATSYTFTNVMADHNMTAIFAVDSTASYLIEVVSSHGAPTSSSQVNAGASFTASVTGPDGDTSHRWICTGYSIDGGMLVSGTSFTFTNVQAMHTITFNWQEQYHLTVISLEGSTTGTGWYNTGATAIVSVPSNTITSDNDIRQIFMGWVGDATGTETTSSPITMNSPKTASATWKTQYQVTFIQNGIASDASGTIVTILGQSKTCEQLPISAWIDAGDSIIFSYAATVESNEVGKVYTLASTNSSSPLTIDEPIIIQAYYEPQASSGGFNLSTIALAALLLSVPPSVAIPLLARQRKGKMKITIVVNEGGSISPNAVQLIERGGDSTVFIITPHSGYRVADVVIDKSIHLGPVRTYKFSNVTKDHTISAIFHKY